ncbi:hypothetical protein GALL_107780 [mine drainage metagenome]|uniref:Uncharacterized protein n=1 Tax=mine drainage metagenome TaxID=410659 RepID=A0A1J5ST37_9ZZZZ
MADAACGLSTAIVGAASGSQGQRGNERKAGDQ